MPNFLLDSIGGSNLYRISGCPKNKAKVSWSTSDERTARFVGSLGRAERAQEDLCQQQQEEFSDVLKETVCTSQEKLEKRNTMTQEKVKLNKRLRFFLRFDSLASGQKIDSTTRSSRFRKKSRGSPQFLREKGTNLRFATCKWYNKTGGQSQPVRTIAPPKTSGGSFGNWDAWMGCWCSRWCC